MPELPLQASIEKEEFLRQAGGKMYQGGQARDAKEAHMAQDSLSYRQADLTTRPAQLKLIWVNGSSAFTAGSQ